MTTLILTLHFAATAALWNQTRQALAMSWATAAIYAGAFGIWWGCLLILGVDYGKWLAAAYQ